MIERKWVRLCEDKVDQLREVLNFFGMASPEQWTAVWEQGPIAMFRQSQAFQAHPGAVATWLRRGELQAQLILCAPYDRARFRAVLQEIRALTVTLPDDFAARMTTLCASAGVALVFVPALSHTHVSGATRWLTPDKALIQLSLRYKQDDRFWFSFFHEAGHILLHGKRDAFVDSEESKQSVKEEEADRFAADLLIPPRAYKRFVQETRPYFSKVEITEFAREHGVTPGVVAGRLQHDGHIPFMNCNGLKREMMWSTVEEGQATDR